METDGKDLWAGPQGWVRDGEGPCVALGEPGEFDDTHIFGPCVAYEDGVFRLWYCGAQGAVAERVFRVGLATSADGVHFAKHPAAPVLAFADGRRSVLTPTLLRHADGAVCREDGRLRMWLSGCDLTSTAKLHTLHETSSLDGVTWEPPSEGLLENVYAPTVIKEDGAYRLWYTDVSQEPWCFRHASSVDGCNWEPTPGPVVALDQEWEYANLFYPTVLKHGDSYLMWYGSYQSANPQKTALGLAVSTDGLSWQKNAHNPVFGPDESRVWESHYTTSQSVLRFDDGSWRIWYATRTKPPFVHKYFAVGTASWRPGV